MLQLSCLWNLSQPGVKSVIPTLIQEVGEKAKPIEKKVDELAALPEIKFTDEEKEFILMVGNNKGCMELKGSNRAHVGESRCLTAGASRKITKIAAKQWGVDPDGDLAYTHKAAG